MLPLRGASPASSTFTSYSFCSDVGCIRVHAVTAGSAGPHTGLLQSFLHDLTGSFKIAIMTQIESVSAEHLKAHVYDTPVAAEPPRRG
jgi:hypothetical protein